MESSSRQIRGGILHYDTTFDLWMAEAIDQLRALEYVKVCLLIIADGSARRPRLLDRLSLIPPDRWAFEFYERFFLGLRGSQWASGGTSG